MSSNSLSLDANYKMLIGTYSNLDVLAHQPKAASSGEGIYELSLSATGEVKTNNVVPILNPAVLIPHPGGGSVYAILETIKTNGEIVQFNLQGASIGETLGTYNASGKSTCYLALSPQRDVAIVINYWDAIIDVVQVDSEGRLGDNLQSFKQYHRPEGEWRQVTTREDHWANRQVGPHAHCAHFWKNWVFIPDLGENAVFQYQYDAGTKQLKLDTYISFEKGSGPRHMAMHPSLNICYISNELFNTVCVAELDDSDADESKARLIPVQYESTLLNREQESYVSEIKLSPDAKFLYVSNRGDDSLAIFKVLDDGKLELTAVVPTGGVFPRHFAITPCGKAVIVANQDTSTLTFFNRDIETGLLTMTDFVYEIPSPNYIRFIH